MNNINDPASKKIRRRQPLYRSPRPEDPPMKFGKQVRNYILLVVLLIFGAVELPIIAIGQSAQPAPSDVIIVLGAKLIDRQPSAVLRLRLDEAARLYQAGYAPSVIVSGAQGADEEISEAAAMRDYLITHGVPPDTIISEDGSYSTYQNLANSRDIMQQRGHRTAIIVSSSSHIRRALVLARQLNMEVSGAPAPMPANGWLTFWQYLREGAAMMSLAVFNK